MSILPELPQIPFDYALLEAETRIVVQQRTGEIKALGRKAAQDIIEMGGKFDEVRKLLRHNKHGGFEAWYIAEKFTKSFVYRCLAVHRMTANRSNLERLQGDLSALYLLAAATTPEDVQDDVFEEFESGAPITLQIVQGKLAPKGKTFKQYDTVFYSGIKSQITSINPTSGTYNVRPFTGSWHKEGIEANELFETYEAWKAADPPKQSFDPVVNALNRAYHYAETLRDGWHTFPYGNYQSRELVESLIAIGLIEAAHYGKPDEKLRLTPAGCQKINQPLAKWMLPADQAPSSPAVSQAVPSDPDGDDLPLPQTHPFFSAQDTASATCAGCGETDARWKAVRGGFWAHTCGVKTADSEMQPYTKEDMDAEGRMEHRRSGRLKPRSNISGEHAEDQPDPRDRCQTPDYAIDPLLPFLRPEWTIWEPACGEGLLVDALYDGGMSDIFSGDLLTGQDFLKGYTPKESWDVIVTNPPYSTKYDFLARAYALGKPFALLMPIDTFGSKAAQALFKEHGIEVIFMNERVDFKMPEKGWDGDGAHFSTAWFCWQLGLGQDMTFADTTEGKKGFVKALIDAGEKTP